MDKLSSTQIGAIAENHVTNMLIITSGGRLSAFQPVADDDGIDLLIYDKKSGRALPAQVKSRTVTINRSGSQERSDIVHFEIREATYRVGAAARLTRRTSPARSGVHLLTLGSAC